VTPGDQKERLRAIQSKANLAVTAGAGTGKTTLLVSKILHKVVDEGVGIDRILALTFTEKAANEMRERLREGLEEAGRLEGLDRAEIGTIHSFCAHVLRQFPVEAGVAPGFEVDEGAVFRRRFEEAWPRWLDRELGPGARRPRQWEELLEKVELSAMRALAEGLASFGVPDERTSGAAALGEHLAEVAGELPELASALSGREVPAKPPSKATARVKSAYRLAQDVALIDEGLVGRAVEFAEDFARGFRSEFLAAGYVTFDAMLALVYRLLRSEVFPNVLQLLRERYRYILVDEFQDTDPVQGEIIQRLAEGPDGELVPGRLFLVGDPKQSIYSFRGADIVAYHGVVDRILREGGEKVVLRTNFRSHGRILDFVNSVFSRVIVENRRLQPAYEPIEPREGRKAGYPEPTIEAIVVRNAKAEASRHTEAAEVAGWIQDHRNIPYKDIAILFRSLVDVPMYLEALRATGIPYVVEGEKYFYGTTEVIDFVNLLRAVVNPHDRIAVAGVLRSPCGGMTDQELYTRRKSLDYRAASDLPLFDPPIFKFLRRWHEVAGRSGVGELIDAIFTDSYALEIAQAGYHGEQAVANLLKLRRKAGELEAQGGCTLAEFLQSATQAVRELEEEGESPLSDETLDAVRILSIHRAKGLEFPVVMLPDLHRHQATKPAPVVRYDWPTRTLGVRLGGAMNAGGAALAYLDRERRREEWRRLLYVALTRAKEILVLLGSGDHTSESYIGLLMDELRQRARMREVDPRRPRPAPPPAPPGGERHDWDAFVSLWRDRERRATPARTITSPSRLEEEAASPIERESGPPGIPERAVRVGIECHAVLERLDFKKPAVPPGTDPEAARILRKFFKSAPFRSLAGSEILARELPFVIPRGGQIVQGVIDVVYRRRGRVYASDYKSDKVMNPGDYGLIREIYTEAARRVLGVEPGFTLIYLRHGKEVEWNAQTEGEGAKAANREG
jgi:ATP-dependent helicase/nuclease subunit A